MKIEKLELKYLACYLPYGLKIKSDMQDGYHTLAAIGYDNDGTEKAWVHMTNTTAWYHISHYKPILRPLSDFDFSDAYKEINETYTLGYDNGLFNDAMVEGFEAKWLPYEAMQILFANHFDVFNLIESGLAVDINTIDL